ncbi:MAG: transposase [Pyrinomonadaceae bacterium]
MTKTEYFYVSLLKNLSKIRCIYALYVARCNNVLRIVQIIQKIKLFFPIAAGPTGAASILLATLRLPQGYGDQIISRLIDLQPSTPEEPSRWIHETFPNLRSFAWQDGYGIFSVSKSNVPDVVEYIKSQREHHQKHSFEDEYVSMLRLNGIDYDERYTFD